MLFNPEDKINATPMYKDTSLKSLFPPPSELCIPKKMVSAYPDWKNRVHAYKTNIFHNKKNHHKNYQEYEAAGNMSYKASHLLKD